MYECWPLLLHIQGYNLPGVVELPIQALIGANEVFLQLSFRPLQLYMYIVYCYAYVGMT